MEATIDRALQDLGKALKALTEKDEKQREMIAALSIEEPCQTR